MALTLPGLGAAAGRAVAAFPLQGDQEHRGQRAPSSHWGQSPYRRRSSFHRGLELVLVKKTCKKC